MAYRLEEINRRIKNDAAGFIGECDENFENKVRSAAEQIAENLKKNPIVLLSGPSGSGKTTTAIKMKNVLGKLGVKSQAISLDNYYRAVDPKTAPRNEKGEIDLESPECLDLALLNRHFEMLSRGEEILVPKYDFTGRRRAPGEAEPRRIGKNEVAVFEGIHALNSLITSRNPDAMKLYINARSNFEKDYEVWFKNSWIRLSRRIIRDEMFRGTEPGRTIKMWANIRRGEKKYISPYKHDANILLDTVLPYEVSVLKNFVPSFFESIGKDNTMYEELEQIRPRYLEFEAVDPALVAKDSLIREFIGGSAYEY